MSHGLQPESDVPSLRWPAPPSNAPARPDPGWPSGGEGTGSSLTGSFLQAFIEPAMFLFPVARPNLNRFTGIEPFQSQRLELGFCFSSVLVRTDQTFHVRLQGKSLRLGRSAQFGFEIGMDGDTHVCMDFNSIA